MLNLKKDLPEIFDDFAENRQNSFIRVKELKDKNIPIVGVFCTFFPSELAFAAGASCISLCSTSDETIPVAEKDLPKIFVHLLNHLMDLQLLISVHFFISQI